MYRLITDVDGDTQHIALHNVLYLPDLEKNLLSVHAMAKLGASVEFKGNECRIMRNSKLLGTGKIQGKLYMLNLASSHQANIAKEDSKLHLWHLRYGHLGTNNVVKLFNDKMVEGMDFVKHEERKSLCKGCIMGKQHRVPYPKGNSDNASEVLEIVHSDVCGPMNIPSLGQSVYFVTFIDDFSRFMHIYFIKQKSEVLEKFKEFFNMASNTTGKQVKILRTDNGGEYCSNMFSEY